MSKGNNILRIQLGRCCQFKEDVYKIQVILLGKFSPIELYIAERQNKQRHLQRQYVNIFGKFNIVCLKSRVMETTVGLLLY